MRQLIKMFFFDVKTTFKSFMGGYMLIVPTVIIIILRSFLPQVASTTATVAVVDSGKYMVSDEVISELEKFVEVLRFETIEQMEDKLRGIGSTEGLYYDPDNEKFISVMERNIEKNTVFSISSRIIRQIKHRELNPDVSPITEFSYGVPEELSDRTKISPVATLGGSIYLVFMVIICAFIIGLNIVNDKEEGTDKALKVSPVSKKDYFFGKSIFSILILAFYTLICLLVMELTQVNILQTYTVIIATLGTSMFLGSLLGALAKNETEAMGIGKLLSTLSLLSILAGSLLPDNWQWVVYWVPFYWIMDVLEEIFTQSATWSSVLIKTGLILGITSAYFLILRKKIVKGLT